MLPVSPVPFLSLRSRPLRLRLLPAGLAVLCFALLGCASVVTREPQAVLRDADPALADQKDVLRFEARLNELGARLEKGSQPNERAATVTLPAKPGHAASRTLHVVYLVHDRGMIEVRSAEMKSR